MEQVAKVTGVIGTAPFSINPMMLTHGDATATGVLLKGVDPTSSLGVDAPKGAVPVLDLPKHIIDGKLEGLRLPDAKPPERRVPSALGPSDALDDLLDAGAAEPPPEIDDAGRNLTLIRKLEEDTKRRLDKAAEHREAQELKANAPEKPAAEVKV